MKRWRTVEANWRLLKVLAPCFDIPRALSSPFIHTLSERPSRTLQRKFHALRNPGITYGRPSQREFFEIPPLVESWKGESDSCSSHERSNRRQQQCHVEAHRKHDGGKAPATMGRSGSRLRRRRILLGDRLGVPSEWVRHRMLVAAPRCASRQPRDRSV